MNPHFFTAPCEIVYTRRERRGYIKWVMLLS